MSTRNGEAPSGALVERQLERDAIPWRLRVIPSHRHLTNQRAALIREMWVGGYDSTEVRFSRLAPPFCVLPTRRVKTGRAMLERVRLTRVDARNHPKLPPLFLRA